MCSPIALTGLQIAGALASGAAQQAELKHQARQAEMQARADAKNQIARAEFARDDVERLTAADRAARLSQPTDPKSETTLSTLSATHARRLDTIRDTDHQAASALYRGREQSREIRRSVRRALTQSLFSLAETALSRTSSASTIRLPL